MVVRRMHLMAPYPCLESAENTQLGRIAERDPDLLPQVEALSASGAWLELEKEFKQRWITGGSTSRKSDRPSGQPRLGR